MTSDDTIVRTARLELIPWTLPLIDAFMANDRAAAEAALGIIFPDPFAAPPETDDILPLFRNVVAEDTSEGVFVPRMIVRIADRMSVGSIGCMTPDEAGASLYGYGIYPAFEGNGYASEAAAGIVNWALALDGIHSVTATIPVGHTASEIVSSRAGLVNSGRQTQGDGMTLNIWERRRS